MKAFIPMFNPPLRGKQSARVGWVVAENGCHIWQGARDRKGYGRVQVDDRVQYVHRVRYEREVGPIPAGMDLDHFECDNGPGACCNPQHVRPTTRRENVLRSETLTAMQAAKTHCPQGHPYSGENLYVTPRTGARACRACLRRHACASRVRRQASTPLQEIR